MCDGAFFRGQDVIVVGGGDTAMEESMYLSGLCTQGHARAPARRVPREQDDAGPRPQEPEDPGSSTTPAIDEVLDVSKGEVTGVRVRGPQDEQGYRIVPVTGFFVAIGHTPNTDLFAGQLDLHDNGYIRTKPGTTQTSVPGVFAAGDVQDFVYRQAVTAAGTGCMAALDAERWLAANSSH